MAHTVHAGGLEMDNSNNKFDILQAHTKNVFKSHLQLAGTIINELDPMGLLETNGDEDENVKGTSYLI